MPPPLLKPLDLRIGELAARQHGLVRRGDLGRLGVTREQRRHRLACGRLHELHPGVYAVGHPAVSRRAAFLAAVWWCGDGAALSHASAAAFRGWLREDDQAPPTVHVTTTRARRSRPGVVVHRTRHLPLRDVQRWGLLWVTDDPRTVVDLADDATFTELRSTADRLPELPVAAIARCAADLPGRRGAGRVQELISSEDACTRSALERRSVRYLAHHDVPQPDGRNVLVHGIRVDCWYAGPRLVLELDSRAHHARRSEMEADRRRDRALARHGIRTLRLMWHDLDPLDGLAAADIRLHLTRGA